MEALGTGKWSEGTSTLTHAKLVFEPRYSLADAASRFFPGGRITKRSLQTEIRKGRLRAELIAGKHFVTESAIQSMCVACQLAPAEEMSCHGESNQPAFTSENAVVDSLSGPSSTERAKLMLWTAPPPALKAVEVLGQLWEQRTLAIR